MHSSFVLSSLVIALLLAGACADWEVLNDVSDANVDDFDLQKEHLLPVDAASKRGNNVRHAQRSLSSIDQLEKKNLSQDTVLKVEPEHQSVSAAASTTQRSTESKAADDLVTSQKPSANHASSPSSDDDIDLVSEGLLLVESIKGQGSANNRKLAQFNEQLPQDTSDKTSQKISSEVVSEKQSEISDSSSKQQLKFQSAEAKAPYAADSEIYMDSLSFKVACIDESSWECLMFKEDFLAMKGDLNLSHRASVLERTKRQAKSHYNNFEVVNNIGRNLLGCEDGGCFSGGGNGGCLPENGTNTGEEEVIPEFIFLADTKFNTTFTSKNLTDANKEELAKKFHDQLVPIFHNIPGFKNVSVNPKYVYIDTDFKLVFDDWEVIIDGGNGNFTGLNGSGVSALVLEALNRPNSTILLKAVTIDGKPPNTDFDPNNAAQQVEFQASDPCGIKPNPCSYGYGHCQRLPNTNDCAGIHLKCSDNCANYSDCSNNGVCSHDMAGAAFCNCSTGRIGLYCDKKETPNSNQDEIVSPEYTINLTVSFPPSTLKPEELTPQKRAEIAKQIEEQLKQIMQYTPGFKDITVDPNAIYFDKNGNLVVPWNMTLSGSAPAFAGKSPEQIGDLVRGSLQNVSDVYKNNVTINGQTPVDDLDAVEAGKQVTAQAKDPCGHNPCHLGYGHCEAISATSVKCIHNCNARPEECKNGAECMLDSKGAAVCQCSSGWSGENCDSKDEKLNGGQIAGVVVGSALVACGLIGSCCWFLLCARMNQKDMNFSHYTDEEGSGRSSSSNKPYVIARPEVQFEGLALFRSLPQPNSGNFSRASSHGSSGSTGGPQQPNPFRYSHA